MIDGALKADELVIDAGDANDTTLNSPHDLGRGEGLLYLTTERLLFANRGEIRSWDYAEIDELEVVRVRGLNRHLRRLRVSATGQIPAELSGGRTFLRGVFQIARRAAKSADGRAVPSLAQRQVIAIAEDLD